ncbi:MAG: hypothetical protein INQ03_00645 [Candidatus Heimdallarchaeota archaeon]|nr:hypothetical protein [Candidatus Heimdallarchaeota archaeon]
MKILSITIYSRDFNLVFHKTIEQSMDEQTMEGITSFLNGVNRFGNEVFSEELRRIDMHGVWLDFLYIEDYIIVIVSEIESGISERENIVYDSIISQIEDFIHGMLIEQDFSFDNEEDMEFFGEFIQMKLDALQLGKVLIPNEIEQAKDGWTLLMAMICDNTGLPIHFKTYKRLEIDPYIVSMLLSTFQSFARIEFRFELKNIHLGKRKICVFRSDGKLYVLVIDTEAKMEKSTSIKIQSTISRIMIEMANTKDEESDEITDDNPAFRILDHYM